jgi:hypothetical protein
LGLSLLRLSVAPHRPVADEQAHAVSVPVESLDNDWFEGRSRSRHHELQPTAHLHITPDHLILAIFKTRAVINLCNIRSVLT